MVFGSSARGPVSILLFGLLAAPASFLGLTAQAQTSAPAVADAPAQQRAVGAIKAITDHGIVMSSDAGDEVQVSFQDATRILRVAPGEKDLKNATPLQKQDLQVGDRILVRGKAGADTHSIVAGAVVVMKHDDVAAKQQKERDDWQKRGIGGLVTAVDPATGNLTISTTSFTGTKTVAVHTTKSTVLRRYAPNSVKFDDAKVAPIEQIKVGDQLRARGTKNEDGATLDAEEVVSGSFRNLAGAIVSVDTAANTLTLKDSISKQTVVVRVTSDAQLRKLPAEFAQRIATRLKGAAAAGIPGAAAATGGASDESKRQPDTAQSGGGGMGPGGSGPGRGSRNGGSADIQQILSRIPPSNLADLQKGDVVMVVCTNGDSSGTVNAITLLAGVEPILTAAPNATQAMMLSPWSLGSGNAEAAANP
jgi:transcription antitermination factor NusG